MKVERAGSDTAAIVSAAGGLLATLATGAACVGPLLAVALGVGGFGWLTRYAHLRVPATIATATMLAVGFYVVHVRSRRPACARRTRSRLGPLLLWIATTLAVAVNLFEYLVFPRLG